MRYGMAVSVNRGGGWCGGRMAGVDGIGDRIGLMYGILEDYRESR